jgi:3-oxoacyl-(acyl-carrier-protein) synthase
MADDVYVTGTGVVSCAGNSPAELWENALHGRSGIVEGVGRVDLSSSAPEKGTEPVVELGAALRFSLDAAHQALRDSSWIELQPDDGLILATTTGQIPLWEKALVDFLQETVPAEEFRITFANHPIGALLDAVCDHLRFEGKNFLVTSACASSTQALALGANWIQEGRVKRCLVIGVEVLCQLTLEGFKSLQLLSATAARPFDLNRTGINLSEGAGALCLETSPQKTPLAKLSGFGLSTDSYHMTAPEPAGRGCQRAIRAALASAELEPGDISWVHAHGTGSNHNDLAEGFAIANCFEGYRPFVSSTKNIHGHALGASGAIETVLCIEALKHQHVLHTNGLENPDPSIQVRHPKASVAAPLDHILKSTLGFGGANAVVILSRPGLEGEF